MEGVGGSKANASEGALAWDAAPPLAFQEKAHSLSSTPLLGTKIGLDNRKGRKKLKENREMKESPLEKAIFGQKTIMSHYRKEAIYISGVRTRLKSKRGGREKNRELA